MSIRNLINPQIKGWLDANVNVMNANAIRVNASDIVNFKVGSILRLQGSAGTSGDIVQKDGSNDASWTSVKKFGDKAQSSADEVTVFTTLSGVWQLIPIAFIYSNMPIGEYLIYWSVELKNPSGPCLGRVVGTAGPIFEYQTWALNGGVDEYHCCSGFFPLTVASPLSITWEMQIKSVTAPQVTSARRVRFIAFRTS